MKIVDKIIKKQNGELRAKERLVLGIINYMDENYPEALYHLDKARNLSKQETELTTKIYVLLAKIFAAIFFFINYL